MEVERLSLENFEPSRAHAPYLNTPRSVEACRRHGVTPIELVEVSIDEFRKTFPNDPDIANRRYGKCIEIMGIVSWRLNVERINGARLRILRNVLVEWQHLKEIGWTPEIKVARVPQGEQIIPVPPEAHCELLEIQVGKLIRLLAIIKKIDNRHRRINSESWSRIKCGCTSEC